MRVPWGAANHGFGARSGRRLFTASRVTTSLANGHRPTITLFVLLDVVLVAGYTYLLTLAVRRLKSKPTLLTEIPSPAPRTAAQ
jgi:hypothetical protein